MTRETVIADTPARRATSSIVALPRLRRLALAIDAPSLIVAIEPDHHWQFARGQRQFQRRRAIPPRRSFNIEIAPHSFSVFKPEPAVGGGKAQ
jgi:hypothetical protein